MDQFDVNEATNKTEEQKKDKKENQNEQEKLPKSGVVPHPCETNQINQSN